MSDLVKLIEAEPEETKKRACFLATPNRRYKATAALMLLEIVLKIAMYAMGIKIFAANISVAYSNAELNYFNNYTSSAGFGILTSLLLTWLKYPFTSETCVFNDIVCVSCVFIDVVTESNIYRELACLNQDLGSIVKVRAFLVFLHVATQYASLLLSCYTIFTESAKYLRDQAVFCVLLAVAIGSMLALNMHILARDKPLAYGQISPRHIHMAFFNQTEIRKIQRGTYKRDSTFETRLVGRLSDVVESIDTLPNRSGSLNETWLIYTFDIECTPRNRLVYADCANNVTSLSIGVRYLDKSHDFPSYSCEVNLNEENLCMAKCERLFASKYELITIQLRDGRVEPAWTGLSSCNPRPNVRLIRDEAFSPCLLF